MIGVSISDEHSGLSSFSYEWTKDNEVPDKYPYSENIANDKKKSFNMVIPENIGIHLLHVKVIDKTNNTQVESYRIERKGSLKVLIEKH